MTEAQEHLKKLLEEAVVKHTRRKDTVRRISWSLKIVVMLLGMIATIILGFSFKEGSDYVIYSRNGALICTALSTFFSGLASFWDIEHYWIKRKVIVTQLEGLLEEFEFCLTGTTDLSNDQIQGFFQRYQNIVQQQTEYWEGKLAGTPTTTKASATADDGVGLNENGK
jgi:hypothetical protein